MVPVTIMRLRLVSGSLVDEMTEEIFVRSGHQGSKPCMATVFVVSKRQRMAPGKVSVSMQDDGSQETIESAVAILFMDDIRLRDDASVHLAEETGSRKKVDKDGTLAESGHSGRHRIPGQVLLRIKIDSPTEVFALTPSLRQHRSLLCLACGRRSKGYRRTAMKFVQISPCTNGWSSPVRLDVPSLTHLDHVHRQVTQRRSTSNVPWFTAG
jgi:hypothetical protein